MAVVSCVKRKNMLDVLKCLRFYGPLTKLDIMKHTGLTAGTVSTFVNNLISLGISKEEGISLSNGGRKAVIYSLNPKILYIVGAAISIERLTIGVFDLDFNIIDIHEEKYEIARHTVEDGIQYITETINSLILQSGIDREKIAGIGISVPGPVDYRRGVVVELPHAGRWKNIPLKSILSEKTGFNVIIDNDNNCNVLFLKSIKPQMNNNLIYLSTVEGIGVGILIDGRVYRGSRFLAGEIGHVSIHPDGAQCSCGNRGCIELYASNLSIAESAREKMNYNKDTTLHELCGGDTSKVDMEMIIKSARLGDRFCLGLLEDASEYISLCVDNIIKSYDPDIIILDSKWLPAFPNIKNSVINKIFERTDFIKRDDMKIEMCDVENLFLKGAATLILEEQFSEENENSLIWSK